MHTHTHTRTHNTLAHAHTPQSLREQYLTYRRVFLQDSSDVFEERRRRRRLVEAERGRVKTGPPPFSTAMGQTTTALAALSGGERERDGTESVCVYLCVCCRYIWRRWGTGCRGRSSGSRGYSSGGRGIGRIWDGSGRGRNAESAEQRPDTRLVLY